MSLVRHHSVLRGMHRYYKDIIEYAIAQGYCLPSQRVQDAQNNFIKRRVNIGQWEIDDLLYNYYNDACDINFSRINWHSPGNFTLSVNGTLTFTKLSGVVGNGSTGYFGTGYTPSTHAVHASAATCGFEWYTNTNSQAINRYDLGNDGNTLFRVNLRGTGGNTQLSLYDGAVNVAGPADCSGHFLAWRNQPANNGSVYRNGADTMINTGGSNALSTGQITIFRHQTDYSNRGGRMFATGGNYAPYITLAYQNWNNYINSI